MSKLQHNDRAIAAASAWLAAEDGVEDPYEMEYDHEGCPIGLIFERPGYRAAAIGILTAIEADINPSAEESLERWAALKKAWEGRE